MDENKYIDHFNHNSAQYAQCRPDYPDALFDFLAQQVGGNAVVWDCGTGTGQAACALALRFKRVIATDINEQQLAHAPQRSNITYLHCLAEQTPIEPYSVNLITIAQALHWFDLPKFYTEVRRVAARQALIAAWCYSLGSFNEPALDELIEHLYYRILGQRYWPKERLYIDEAYQTIPFPFQKQDTPVFSISKEINFMELLGYLATWSAIKEFQRQNNQNPLHQIQKLLAAAWGEPNRCRIINWPLHCLLGKIE